MSFRPQVRICEIQLAQKKMPAELLHDGIFISTRCIIYRYKPQNTLIYKLFQIIFSLFDLV